MRCWASYLFYALIAILGTGQILAACGQKGGLYLPPAEQSVPEQAQAAESSTVPSTPTTSP